MEMDSREIKEMKALLKELIAEIGDLRERVYRLEQDSTPLPRAQERRARDFALEAESYENIGNLYREGYHICPIAYGQVRDEEECLFCVNLLEKA
ncbi:MAG: initiation control protein YabA [Solirubrobacterales bacterium]